MLAKTLGFVAAILLSTASVAASEDPSTVTRQVSEHYLALDTAGRYDELLGVYAADAVFSDPTGDVFQGPIAKGPIVGADAIIALQKSWGLAEQTFDVRRAFTVGEVALHQGTITVRYQGSDTPYPIPFVTAHTVRDGKIVQRIDFGEYVKSLALGDRFDANTANTQDIADRYLKAYLAADFKTQAELCADDIVFQDPTAHVYGPQSGLPIVGRDSLIQRREKTFANVSNFGLKVEQSFVANHHAVYIGTTTYTVGGRDWAQPAVFVIEVKNGQVTRHWDFVDYSVGPIGS